MKSVKMSLLAGVLLAGVAALPVLAQQAPTAPAGAAQSQAQTQAPARHREARLMPSQLVEGKIAFLKAELKITPAQESEWNGFAQALRTNAQALDQAITTARAQHGRSDAVQRMTQRADFDQLRAANDGRLLAAVKPLYASLTPDQQQMANRLLTSHGKHMHHRA